MVKKEISSEKELPGKKKRIIPQLVRRRRRGDHCLNCGAEYDEKVNYCPHCGQENNHNRVSFATLVIDFLNNYFSLDSKFANSLLPFFFDPGYLTRKFVEGKRTSFVNPIRLYLIISLIFFFVFSMVSSDIVEKTAQTVDEVEGELSDSSKVAVTELLTEGLSEINTDTTITLTNKDGTLSNYQLNFEKPDSTNDFVTEENIQTFMRLRNNYDISPDQLMDSLKTESLSTFQYNLTRQFIRLSRSDRQVVVSQILQNLPIMMLFTMPFFALLLKLFYLRRYQYYITHLIHALHLHSFAYLIFGLAIVMAWYWVPDGFGFYVLLGSVVLASTHSYISFLKVYKQGWFKTLVKFNLAGFIYSWLLLFAVFIELVLSVATF